MEDHIDRGPGFTHHRRAKVFPALDCRITDCARPVRYKRDRLCAMHYTRIKRHGDALVNMHGARITRHPSYTSWMNMIKRCSSPVHRSYPSYGGRGVKVCHRWVGADGFSHFVEDMGVRPSGCSLDRIDVNGNYEPSNCRWATTLQQVLNRRMNRNNTSGIRGVSFVASSGKRRAFSKRAYAYVSLGYFDTKEAAVAARRRYDNEVIKPLLGC